MIKAKQMLNAQRSMSNAQFRKGFEFDLGRLLAIYRSWALDVGRFLYAKR